MIAAGHCGPCRQLEAHRWTCIGEFYLRCRALSLQDIIEAGSAFASGTLWLLHLLEERYAGTGTLMRCLALQYAKECSNGDVDKFWSSPSCLALYQAHVNKVLTRWVHAVDNTSLPRLTTSPPSNATLCIYLAPQITILSFYFIEWLRLQC